jgi:hypothetical protein
MSREQSDAPISIDSWRNRLRVHQLKAAGLFTVKEVGDACGLPQPVVAQLVPRTDTDAGWMYTAEQLAYAMDIAPDVRSGLYVPLRQEHDDASSSCSTDSRENFRDDQH